MIYTQNLSIQDYSKWLSTNPPLSEIIDAQNSAMADFHKAAANLTNHFANLNTICNGK